MADHQDKIKADVQRTDKLIKDLAQRCYEQAERDGHLNFRFESIAVMAVVAWENEDGEGYEDTTAVFESKRHHIQTGILVDLINGRIQTNTRIE